MCEEPEPLPPPRSRAFYVRALVGACIGLIASLCSSIAFGFAGFDWLEAIGLGGLFGLPIFFSAIRWQAAADFFLGLLEASAMVLSALAAALAAILGAFVS